MTRKIFNLILLFSGIFIAPYLNAQNCTSNKVWACRYDSCGVEEGENKLTWSSDNVTSGIYFLQFQSEENQEKIMLVVTK